MEPILYQSAAKILPLGAGSEVGRSCVVAKFRGVTIMFDCGVHPAHTGVSSLPFFDLIDPAEIDAILITHFHLDHAGALPYFTERSSFKGKVFMTHPTRAIFRWLLNDYVRVSNVSSDNDLFTEKELSQCYEKIIPIDYGQEIKIKNATVIAYNAGHVLGAAMFLVKSADTSLLYTGDYSTEEDRHLKAAAVPPVAVDILISEATYGVQCHQSKEEREARFVTGVSEVVKRGGKCLLPVFALGRAQELLLILDEFWESRKDLHGIPILYASALAKRFMAVYQTYLNMMNDRIQEMAEISNPFHFKHVQSIKNIEAYEDRGPCVMMASPGMLQNGLSRDLFEMWCGDKRNGCIIPGYCVEGTLAKDLLCEPDEITSLKGSRLVVRSSIDYVSFSAHVDFLQNAEFIEGCKAGEIVLVHGEASEMSRLKSALLHRSETRGESIVIHTPRNGESVQVQGAGEISVKYLGVDAPEEFTGFVHVSEDGKVSVVEREKASRIGISEVKIIEKVRIQGASFDMLLGVDGVEGKILEKEGRRYMKVQGVEIFEDVEGSVIVQWESSFKADVQANCIIKGAEDALHGKRAVRPAKDIEAGKKECSKAKAKKKEEKSKCSVPKHCLQAVAQVLANYFSSELKEDGLHIQDRGRTVVLSKNGLTGDEALAETVQEVFDSIAWAVKDEKSADEA
ncbi:cleavage and polyadenylation specificity factor subunit 3 [Nematocida major]|uniref:cleavage and polyadenylation specificity factor subunit 3 n=1 Tax=Nematocida major TaxID=1912982 RepID=UPI0020089DF9|nr:cleavage and polyadenylation specificity factor subunit 3 [Nematocida major]KAH9386244.1 cleavage and polyadenylation specificity factor subunit 3 [Nematocida major]